MATTSTPYLAPTLKDKGFIGVTGKTPFKQANADQIDGLQAAATDGRIPNTPRVTSATATVLNINFDGTQNGNYPAPGESTTNIHKLSELQKDANGEKNTLYMPGVGAQTVPTGALNANGLPDAGASASASASNWDSAPFNKTERNL